MSTNSTHDKASLRKKTSKVVISLCMLIFVIFWTVPVLGLLVSSLRHPQQISNYGWWEVFGDFFREAE